MSVHYKFKSSLEYDTVTFDGLHISVGDLKKSILQQKKIGRSADFDLQVTNAQTKEVYEKDDDLIPKNTSVIVCRVPVASTSKKTWERNEVGPVTSQDNDSPGHYGYDKLAKTADLVNANATEDEKIKAMMTQSGQEYDPSRYVKSRSMTGPLPANYLCYRCGKPGHWIKNCPTNNIDVKRSTGIPRSFMVPVDGPEIKGALLTSTGEFAVPLIDHQAYKEVKKEKPPFLIEPVVEPEPEPQIPEELLCMICRDLLQDAVLIPCCGNSFCDECVRQSLLDSENHECVTCHEIDISPDTLIPNRFLRTAVMNFKNETGYTRIKKLPTPVPISVPTLAPTLTQLNPPSTTSEVPPLTSAAPARSEPKTENSLTHASEESLSVVVEMPGNLNEEPAVSKTNEDKPADLPEVSLKDGVVSVPKEDVDVTNNPAEELTVEVSEETKKKSVESSVARGNGGTNEEEDTRASTPLADEPTVERDQQAPVEEPGYVDYEEHSRHRYYHRGYYRGHHYSPYRYHSSRVEEEPTDENAITTISTITTRVQYGMDNHYGGERGYRGSKPFIPHSQSHRYPSKHHGAYYSHHGRRSPPGRGYSPPRRESFRRSNRPYAQHYDRRHSYYDHHPYTHIPPGGGPPNQRSSQHPPGQQAPANDEHVPGSSPPPPNFKTTSATFPQPAPPGISPHNSSLPPAQPQQPPPPGVGPPNPLPPPVSVALTPAPSYPPGNYRGAPPPHPLPPHVHVDPYRRDYMPDSRRIKNEKNWTGDPLDQFARELMEQGRHRRSRQRSRDRSRHSSRRRGSSRSRSHSYRSSKSPRSRSRSRSYSRSRSFSSRSRSRSRSYSYKSWSRSRSRSYSRSRTRSRSRPRRHRSRSYSRSRSRSGSYLSGSRSPRRRYRHSPVRHYYRSRSRTPKYKPTGSVPPPAPVPPVSSAIRGPFKRGPPPHGPHGRDYPTYFGGGPNYPPHPPPYSGDHHHPPAPPPHAPDHYPPENDRSGYYRDSRYPMDYERYHNDGTARFDPKYRYDSGYDKYMDPRMRKLHLMRGKTRSYPPNPHHYRGDMRPRETTWTAQDTHINPPPTAATVIETKPVTEKVVEPENPSTTAPKSVIKEEKVKDKSHHHHHHHRTTKEKELKREHKADLAALKKAEKKLKKELAQETDKDQAIANAELSATLEIKKERKHRHKKSKTSEDGAKKKKRKSGSDENSSQVTGSESEKPKRKKNKKKKEMKAQQVLPAIEEKVEESALNSADNQVAADDEDELAGTDQTSGNFEMIGQPIPSVLNDLSDSVIHQTKVKSFSYDNSLDPVRSSSKQDIDNSKEITSVEKSVSRCVEVAKGNEDIGNLDESGTKFSNVENELYDSGMLQEDSNEGDDLKVTDAAEDLQMHLPELSKWERDDFGEGSSADEVKVAPEEPKKALSTDIIQKAEKVILHRAMKTSITAQNAPSSSSRSRGRESHRGDAAESSSRTIRDTEKAHDKPSTIKNKSSDNTTSDPIIKEEESNPTSTVTASTATTTTTTTTTTAVTAFKLSDKFRPIPEVKQETVIKQITESEKKETKQVEVKPEVSQETAKEQSIVVKKAIESKENKEQATTTSSRIIKLKGDEDSERKIRISKTISSEKLSSRFRGTDKSSGMHDRPSSSRESYRKDRIASRSSISHRGSRETAHDESKFEPNYDGTSDTDKSGDEKYSRKYDRTRSLDQRKHSHPSFRSREYGSSRRPLDNRKRYREGLQERFPEGSAAREERISKEAMEKNIKDKKLNTNSESSISTSDSSDSGSETGSSPKKLKRSDSPTSDHKHGHRKSKHKKHKKHKRKHKKKKAYKSRDKDEGRMQSSVVRK